MMCTGSNGESKLFPEHLSIHSRTPKPVEIPAPTDKPDWNGLTAIAHTTYNGFALFDDGKLYAWGDSRYSGGAGNESICPTTGTVKCIDPRYGICATWEGVNQNFIYACDRDGKPGEEYAACRDQKIQECTNIYLSLGYPRSYDQHSVAHGRNQFATNFLTPLEVMTDVKTVKTGESHVCVVKTSGKVFCWGQDTNHNGGTAGGGVGTGTNAYADPGWVRLGWVHRPFEVKKIDGTSLISTGILTCGWHMTCALAVDDKIYCWGRNKFSHGGGQLGRVDIDGSTIDATAINSLRPPVFTGECPSNECVANAESHSTGKPAPVEIMSTSESGTAYTPVPGRRLDGACHYGANCPKYIKGDYDATGVKDLNCNENSCCATTADDSVVCWGETFNAAQDWRGGNRWGGMPVLTVTDSGNQQNWNGNYNPSGNPGPNNYMRSTWQYGNITGTPIKAKKLMSSSPRSRHRCIITTDDKVLCWGNDAAGQLGSSRGATWTDTTSGWGSSPSWYQKDASGAEVNAAYHADVPCDSCENNGWLGQETYVPQTVTGVCEHSKHSKPVDVIAGMYTTVVICEDNKIYGFGKNNNRFDLFALTPVKTGYEANRDACTWASPCTNYVPVPTRLTRFEDRDVVTVADRSSGDTNRWWM